MSRPFVWFLAVVVIGLLLTCAGLFLPVDLALNLLLGWVLYLRRVGPEVRVSWDGVALAAVCLAGFAIGLHGFCRWLARSSAVNDDQRPDWPARWTSAIVGLIWLMFVGGIAASGIVHQSGWLLRSPRPWVSNSFHGPTGAASRAASVNNLKQLGVGLHQYEAEFGAFPAGGDFDAAGRGLHGWQTHVLPEIDQEALFNSINLSLPWNDPSNAKPFQTEVATFLSPGFREARTSPRGYALTHYAGNAHVLGGDQPRRLAEITDGAAATIQAGEAAADFPPWGSPTNWRDPALGINRAPNGFGGPFPGGAGFLFVDGSVRFIKNTVDPRVWHAISTPSGGEALNDNEY